MLGLPPKRSASSCGAGARRVLNASLDVRFPRHRYPEAATHSFPATTGKSSTASGSIRRVFADGQQVKESPPISPRPTVAGGIRTVARNGRNSPREHRHVPRQTQIARSAALKVSLAIRDNWDTKDPFSRD